MHYLSSTYNTIIKVLLADYEILIISFELALRISK